MIEPSTIRSTTIPAYVYDAMRLCQWPGIVLPKTVIDNKHVYPVVEIIIDAWEYRKRNHPEPELTLSTLHIWESWLPELGPTPPPSPLTIVGFISDTTPIEKAFRNVQEFGGYGAELIIYRGKKEPQTFIPILRGIPLVLVMGRDIAYSFSFRHALILYIFLT